MFFEHSGEVGFPFSDMVLSYKQYVFSLMEHVIRFMLAICILIGSTRYRVALCTFVVIEFLEIVDFVLTWGDPWFDSKIFTWNTIKVGMMGSAILYEKYGKL
jgi:hypothetical protein